MDDEHQDREVPNISEGFGTGPNISEGFGTGPNVAEDFGSVRNHSEVSGIIRTGSEKKESHTLSVRDVARMFEGAGGPRTERSIIKWCQPNRQGIATLDVYYDPNERKYFITPKSVELAIKEEQHKGQKLTEVRDTPRFGTVPNGAEQGRPATDNQMLGGPETMKGLKQEIMDLKITNRAKDLFIEELQTERRGFALERQGYVEKLMTSNRRIGDLESKVLQLSPPAESGTESPIGRELQWDERYVWVEATTPLGLSGLFVVDPGLLAGSQPWALSQNPFGIPEPSYGQVAGTSKVCTVMR
jgi:hypothetical protein